jgi:hypothetical protein
VDPAPQWSKKKEVRKQHGTQRDVGQREIGVGVQVGHWRIRLQKGKREALISP